ncbi:4Fe-4S dicluster domain-containing protein [Archaeoglobus veneficus]|uniref:Ferredoxin n=1 Tax=Archaeoglobus veneficus (strain DSM 11195 / SNP6) TaxID=693661 RepID=F2KRH4_ARCVS|nr:4Fe-4S dicluster domain-containing protein [Archaeoglobus veneficus]AEA46739.1 4Fe-4S ferredoxin iron-sulfur binding domain-containing protein [Archaeoglobus veneficus SNP6]
MYKFIVDTHSNLCIKCKACEAICKNHNNVPPGIYRIRVITINEGKPGQLNIPMPCMHCSDPACLKVCPMDAIYKRSDGIVLVNKDNCIGCGYCSYACPFGAPQFEGSGAFGTKGKMDKCTFCVQPYEQKDENGNIIENEPIPRCAMVCPGGALLAGEASEIVRVFRERIRGYTAKELVEKVFMV